MHIAIHTLPSHLRKFKICWVLTGCGCCTQTHRGFLCIFEVWDWLSPVWRKPDTGKLLLHATFILCIFILFLVEHYSTAWTCLQCSKGLCWFRILWCYFRLLRTGWASSRPCKRFWEKELVDTGAIYPWGSRNVAHVCEEPGRGGVFTSVHWNFRCDTR